MTEVKAIRVRKLSELSFMFQAGQFFCGFKNIWIRVNVEFLHPERESCGLKNIRIRINRAYAIDAGNFPSNHPCRAASGINQAKNRTTGNTPFMGIAFQAHVIKPLLWVLLSRSLHVKALELPFLWLVCDRIRLNLIIKPNGFENRTRFAREDVGLCLFYGSTVKECNLFTRSFCPIRF